MMKEKERNGQQESWKELNREVKSPRAGDRKVESGPGEWMQHSSASTGGTNVSGQFSHSEQKTNIDPAVLEDESFRPVGIDYRPKDFVFNPEDPAGLLAQIERFSKKPQWDERRAERLRKLARVNALGDLFKHLGSFAGAGNAPVERREENKNVLRAFSELDKMRDSYDSRLDNFNDRMANWLLRARNAALQEHNVRDQKEWRKALFNAQQKKSVQDARRGVVVANGTTASTDGYSGHKAVSSGFQDGYKNMAVPKGSGSGGGKGWRLFITDNNVKDLPSSAKNITNLARAADIIERELPGTRPMKPRVTVDEYGEKNVVMEPDNSQEALERYIAFGFGKRVGGLEAWAANLAGEKTMGGQSGGRPVGEIPATADGNAPPFAPAGLEKVVQGSSGADERGGQIEVPRKVLKDLESIAGGEGADHEKRIAILKRLKEAGYSAEDAKRIVGHITV